MFVEEGVSLCFFKLFQSTFLFKVDIQLIIVSNLKGKMVIHKFATFVFSIRVEIEIEIMQEIV